MPLIAFFVFSLYKIHTTSKRIDEIPLELEKSSLAMTSLKQEIEIVSRLKENLKRSSERHMALLKIADVRTQSSLNRESLKSWRTRAEIERIQLKQDLSLLQQINTGKNISLNKLDLSLKNLTLQEETQWTSLQQFLEKQADTAANSDETELYFQNFIKEFLHTIRALGAYQVSIDQFEDKLQALENGIYLKSREILTESERYKIALQHYQILMIVSLVMIAIASCGAYGLRIRRERRSRERRSDARDVGYARRKSDRS